MERRLAAIIAVDVVGYSRLMAADEAGTLARLQRLRTEVIEPSIGQFGGRVVGSAGDSLLVEFGSAVNAVTCAVRVQEALSERNAKLPEPQRMAFRMGVNLGDVIADGGTIHGDGVNVAARLEKLAEAGGVCISRSIHDQVKGKLSFTYANMGEQRVHNIPEPVQAYQVQLTGVATTRTALPLPDKPSIAVLPFQNMSGDPEQDYFADGMVEEIITALSRFRQLFVIARNSSFTYKAHAVNVKQVGRELGVRYVLEGSVRKAGNRVRITGQLIDAATGTHLWADRFDGGLEDVFDLQDQITAHVVGAILPKLEQAEIERVKRKPTESLDAYDCYLRGMTAFYQWTRETNIEALSHFNRAIELDQNFASAYGMAARCYVQRKQGGWVIDHAQERAETTKLARLAAVLGKDDAVALCTAGDALMDVVGDLEAGASLNERALALNPNLAWAWLFSGWTKALLGEPAIALERIAHAQRLSPQDSQIYSMQAATAFAHFIAGHYDEASSWAEAAIQEQPNFLFSTCVAAASHALAGRYKESADAIVHLGRLNPLLRLSNLQDVVPFRRPADFGRWAEGLRKAGLPE